MFKDYDCAINFRKHKISKMQETIDLLQRHIKDLSKEINCLEMARISKAAESFLYDPVEEVIIK